MGRSLGRVLRAAFQPLHWYTIFKTFKICKNPAQYLLRYVLDLGKYPWDLHFRTPTGDHSIKINIFEDLFTFNEIFIWEVYKNSKKESVFVDIGGNIGLSSLYFLTRCVNTRGVLIEPLQGNIDRAIAQLASFEGRIQFMHSAVSDATGVLEIGVEPTGRYSGVDCLETGMRQVVPAVGINELIETTASTLGQISTIKIDCEGAEQAFMPVIRENNLMNVHRFVIESLPIKDKNLLDSGFTKKIVFDDGIGGVFEYSRQV
ncbi:FkbM family methyltransferase [Sphingomonas cavernae]|uniref:FkbM family methyltransferase n=1 Tax=Sphingomonas cavernae TaxID=2320861 RepID=A0A418WLG0_9SPHN|nr:FkbM family methyltransferase [Sphingomonas cavernae]RJF83125.1 FkbM family methyltransferase [Sphingomonas cavernae]RJF90884.1 FkbM family methyltransferase [Sphingomonas cavernae]